jgi:aspartate aminotransferase
MKVSLRAHAFTRRNQLAVSHSTAENLGRSSWIRRMSDEGQRLKAQYGAENVFDCSLGNPDLEPPPAFRESLLALASSAARGAHGYMPNGGYPEVCAAVARRASRDQRIEIPAAQIVMSVGAAGGLNVVLKTILDPGDEVVAISPYFPEYPFYAGNHGGTFVPVAPRADFSPDPEAIAAALSPRTACVLLNSPNNPTGRVYSREDLAGVAAVLEAHGRRTGRYPYLIADEPYREIVYDGVELPSLMEAYAETIVVSSWSKSLSLPGERIGYVAVSPRSAAARELVAGCCFATRVLGFVNAPALMQRVVARLLDEVADVESYSRRRSLLCEGLRAAGYEFQDPKGAFYVFVRVPGNSAAPRMSTELLDSDVAFVMHLKDNRVIAVPGVGFGYPGYFRLSFCVSEDTIRGSLPRLMEARDTWLKCGDCSVASTR